MSLSKRQIKAFAVIHVAVYSQYFDAFGTDDLEATEEEKAALIESVINLGKKIGRDYPANFETNSQILEWVKQNVK